MLMGVFTMGIRLLAGCLTARGTFVLAHTALEWWRHQPLMVAHIERTLCGMLLTLLSSFIVDAAGDFLSIVVVLIAVYLSVTGCLSLAGDVKHILAHNSPTLLKILLIFLLGQYVVKSGLLTWEFAVQVSFMATYLVVKDSFQLSRNAGPSWFLLLLLGLGLHIVSLKIERCSMQFSMKGNSAQFFYSTVGHKLQHYLKQLKKRMYQRYNY